MATFWLMVETQYQLVQLVKYMVSIGKRVLFRYVLKQIKQVTLCLRGESNLVALQ